MISVSEKPCYLKTGVNPGDRFGHNFYICGNKNERCNFVKKSRYVKYHFPDLDTTYYFICVRLIVFSRLI